MVVSAIVSSCDNELHPKHTAQRLGQLLPNGSFFDSANRYPKDVIDPTWGGVGQPALATLRMPFVDEFVEQTEAKRVG